MADDHRNVPCSSPQLEVQDILREVQEIARECSIHPLMKKQAQGIMKLWHKFAIGAFFLCFSWINFTWAIVFAVGMMCGIGVMIALQIAEDKQKPRG